jgi:hypothetical protein
MVAGRGGCVDGAGDCGCGCGREFGLHHRCYCTGEEAAFRLNGDLGGLWRIDGCLGLVGDC